MQRVSVIIPTFNSEKTIVNAIKSVLNQTYVNLEIIIIDDGSTDNTSKLFNPYVYDNKVKYFYQDNQGQGAARNLGIKKSSGEWIAFLDSDDVWVKNKLEKQLEAVKGKSDVSLVFSNAEFVENDKNVGSFFEDFCPYPNWEKNVFEQILRNNFIVNSSVMVRKDVLEEVDMFSQDQFLRNIEDYDLWLRIISKYKIHLVNEILVEYSMPDINKRSIKFAQKQRKYILTKLLFFVPWSKKISVLKELILK